MIVRENDNLKNNSIAFNILTDDLTTVNYLALAYCIAGIETNKGTKYPSISEVCKSFELYGAKEIKKRKSSTKGTKIISKRIKIKAINVFTGEEKEFLGNEDASKYTGVNKGTVGYYTSGKATKKAHTKEGWRFEKIK